MSPVLQSATHQHCAKGEAIKVLIYAQCFVYEFRRTEDCLYESCKSF